VGGIRVLSRGRTSDGRAQFVPLGHVPALDGLRGVAIILVLGYHSGLVHGGWLGVDLFFVLSGFLITSLLLGERAGTGTISLRSFYRRRACRLFPALYAMIAVFVGVVLVAGSTAGRHASLVSALLGLTYTMNIHDMTAAGGGSPDPTLNHLWSLAVEEQFYIVWAPLLLLLVSRFVQPRKLLVFVIGGAAIAAFAGLSGWITYWDALLAGCAAGVLFTHRLVSRVTKVLWALALVIALQLALFRPEDPATNALVITLFALLCAILILATATEPRSWLARALSFQPLRFVGRISYGLYIWHPLLFVLVGWRWGVPAAFATAIVSYRLVEQPFLRRKSRRSPVGAVPRPVPAAAAAETAAS
jgi:peptidoglycan/LPS O-acetylase OafA/YrhL